MRIFLLDSDGLALGVAMRFMEAGHQVRVWHKPSRETEDIGEGIVHKVADWKASMRWADLILCTSNTYGRGELEPYFAAGFPIIGANAQAAELELDRSKGQEALEAAGIETIPYEVFNDYDKAISYVKRKKERFVSKPWGGTNDKSLSYVAKQPADMIVKLEKWKQTGKLKGEFILQEVVDGVEMAVGGWFGPGGWDSYWNENWEEKRLFNKGLGPNTGEAGTIMRYTRRSKLAEAVLIPVTGILESLRYVGYCDVNCIIGRDGTPWPLEFTMRFGWPHFLISMCLHEGDPAKWLLDLLNGNDTLRCREEVALGVVMAHGDYPHSKLPKEAVSDFPINGRTEANKDYVHFIDVKWAKGVSTQVGDEIRSASGFVTAGDELAVVTGLGLSIAQAQGEAYKLAKEIKMANDPFYRSDIGERLREELPALQKLGYARRMKYE